VRLQAAQLLRALRQIKARSHGPLVTRAHGIAFRLFSHWRTRTITTRRIKEEHCQLMSRTCKSWARAMRMERRCRRARALQQMDSLRHVWSGWQQRMTEGHQRQAMLSHVGEARCRTVFRRLVKRSMQRWRRRSHAETAPMARRRESCSRRLHFKMWVGYTSMSAERAAASIALIAHIKAKAAVSARTRIVLTKYMASWSSACIRAARTRHSRQAYGWAEERFPPQLHDDPHSPTRPGLERGWLQRDIEREIATEMQLVKAMWSMGRIP